MYSIFGLSHLFNPLANDPVFIFTQQWSPHYDDSPSARAKWPRDGCLQWDIIFWGVFENRSKMWPSTCWAHQFCFPQSLLLLLVDFDILNMETLLPFRRGYIILCCLLHQSYADLFPLMLSFFRIGLLISSDQRLLCSSYYSLFKRKYTQAVSESGAWTAVLAVYFTFSHLLYEYTI